MSQSNVSAMLQSTTKNWELTPYELQRVPQVRKVDNTICELPVATLALIIFSISYVSVDLKNFPNVDIIY